MRATTGGIFSMLKRPSTGCGHNGLIFQICTTSLHTIDDYLHNRMFQVKIQATVSKIGHIQSVSPSGFLAQPRFSIISTLMTSPPLHWSDIRASLRT
ncbi:hypothetical protein TNCV_178661 [Trichonephila clavipes]|nr:hypothetical protein TNCV_178661 [Trichonephila clavipes]